MPGLVYYLCFSDFIICSLLLFEEFCAQAYKTFRSIFGSRVKLINVVNKHLNI